MKNRKSVSQNKEKGTTKSIGRSENSWRSSDLSREKTWTDAVLVK